MAIEKFQFLDEVGIQTLAQSIFGKVNTRITERLVTELTSGADDDHVLTAKAILALIGVDGKGTGTLVSQIDGLSDSLTSLSDEVSGLTHLTIDTVVGKIEDVADPKSDVLYMQKDDESDKTWVMYIYRTVDGGDSYWIPIGDTSIDLVNYWSKSDDDVAALREALKIHDVEALTETQITAKVDAAFTATQVLS